MKPPYQWTNCAGAFHSTVRFWAPAFEGDRNETSKTMTIATSIQIKSLNRKLAGMKTGIFVKVFIVFCLNFPETIALP